MLNLVSIWKKNCIFFENYIAHRGIRSVVFIFLNPIWFYVEKGLVAKKKFKIDFAHQRIYHNPKWKEFKNQRPKKSWGGTWKGKSSVIWAFYTQVWYQLMMDQVNKFANRIFWVRTQNQLQSALKVVLLYPDISNFAF